MSEKVYVLLEATEGKSAKVINVPRNKQGVVMADALEGPGKVMMVAEASERHRLAELTIQALISIETMTGEVQQLPVKNGIDTDFVTGSSLTGDLIKVGKHYSK